jgi:phosphatidylglycerophosphate synthase
MYRNLPNALSLLRLILSAVVLVVPQSFLFPLICTAAMSDVLDGFLARVLHATSRFGTALDPLADKVFAIACCCLFFMQGNLSPYTLLALFSRDISLFFFTLYLCLSGQWKTWTIRSFVCGKVSTSLQFIVFLCLALALPVPGFLYVALLGFGILSPLELGFLRSWA